MPNMMIVRERVPRQRRVARRPRLSGSMIQASVYERTETRQSTGQRLQREAARKPLSIVGWYRILRAHHHWTVFQSVRYALWLTR